MVEVEVGFAFLEDRLDSFLVLAFKSQNCGGENFTGFLPRQFFEADLPAGVARDSEAVDVGFQSII